MRTRDTNLRVILASGFQPDYVREVANAYARIGKRVQVIGGDMHANCEFEDGVEFVNLRGRDKLERTVPEEVRKLVGYYARLLRFVAASPSRVIYDVSVGRPLLRCVLMYSMFRLLGKRILYTAHNVLPHDRDTRANRNIFFAIYRIFANEIIVHGEYLKQRIVTEFNVSPERVHVIHHGTYHPANDPAITRETAKQKLGIKPDARVALFFGLQRPYKGTEFAIQALLNYLTRNPQSEETPNDFTLANIHILIRGHAPSTMYRKRLAALIEEARPCLSVDAQFEVVPDSDMELLFKASDVVVIPYLEGSQSGIKYMAYAYGRPVLASAVGSLGEFILSGRTGESFAVGDENEFIAQLSNMFAHLDRYSESNIQSIAYGEFSFEEAMRSVESIVKRLDPSAISNAVVQRELL